MTGIFRINGVEVVGLQRPERLLDLEHVHRLSERHPELVPGARIDPGEPRRWIVLASEVPVPEPEDRRDNRSLDLLLADQDATPTLVERKLEATPNRAARSSFR